MGTWSTSIFGNDLSSDIRDMYEELLTFQKSDNEASDIIMETFFNDVKGTDEEANFWISFAVLQHKYGRIEESVLNHAIQIIDEGRDLENWKEDHKALKKRKEVLDKTKELLLSEQPNRKTFRIPKSKVAIWKPGDLFAYQLGQIKTDYPEYREYAGKYILFRVHHNQRVYRNDLYKEYGIYEEKSILLVHNWMGEQIPDISEINKLTYIKHIEPFGINFGYYRWGCYIEMPVKKTQKPNYIYLGNDINTIQNFDATLLDYYYPYTVFTFDLPMYRLYKANNGIQIFPYPKDINLRAILYTKERNDWANKNINMNL